MTTKSVFISFDYDNDNDLPGNLVAQATRPDSPFNITDRSVRAPIDEKWEKRGTRPYSRGRLGYCYLRRTHP